MGDPVSVSSVGLSQLGPEIIRRLRLKDDEPVLIVEGADFVLVKRASRRSPLERFEELAAETRERLEQSRVTPEDVDDAVRWVRESS